MTEYAIVVTITGFASEDDAYETDDRLVIYDPGDSETGVEREINYSTVVIPLPPPPQEDYHA